MALSEKNLRLKTLKIKAGDGLMEWMTRKEAAEHLRVSLRTFDGLVSKGLFPRYRASANRIVISREDLDSYVKTNVVEDVDSPATVASAILGR